MTQIPDSHKRNASLLCPSLAAVVLMAVLSVPLSVSQ